MAVNFSNVTYGSAPRGWTAGSISPQVPISGTPIANIPTSGNIPSNILQAIGNLNAQQAFRQFLTGMNVPQPQAAPVMTMAAPDPAALLRAQTAAAQQRAAENAARVAQRDIAKISAQINAIPVGIGGITPMGGVSGAQRAGLIQNRFDLQNQLATANSAAFGIPRMSGWMGPVSTF